MVSAKLKTQYGKDRVATRTIAISLNLNRDSGGGDVNYGCRAKDI